MESEIITLTIKEPSETWMLNYKGRQYGGPMSLGRISGEILDTYLCLNYEWVYKSYIKIFPTPTVDVDRWLTLFIISYSNQLSMIWRR